MKINEVSPFLNKSRQLGLMSASEIKPGIGKLGFTISTIYGIGLLIFGLTRIIGGIGVSGTAEFYESIANGNSDIHYLGTFILAVTTIIAIGIPMAVGSLLKTEENEVTVNYFTILGTLAFASFATSFSDYLNVYTIGENYGSLNTGQQEIIVALGSPIIDRVGLFRLTTIGVWLIYIMFVGKKSGDISIALFFVGIVGGLIYIFSSINILFFNSSLRVITNLGALVLGPIIFIWLGFNFRKYM